MKFTVRFWIEGRRGQIIYPDMLGLTDILSDLWVRNYIPFIQLIMSFIIIYTHGRVYVFIIHWRKVENDDHDLKSLWKQSFLFSVGFIELGVFFRQFWVSWGWFTIRLVLNTIMSNRVKNESHIFDKFSLLKLYKVELGWL